MGDLFIKQIEEFFRAYFNPIRKGSTEKSNLLCEYCPFDFDCIKKLEKLGNLFAGFGV